MKQRDNLIVLQQCAFGGLQPFGRHRGDPGTQCLAGIGPVDAAATEARGGRRGPAGDGTHDEARLAGVHRDTLRNQALGRVGRIVGERHGRGAARKLAGRVEIAGRGKQESVAAQPLR